MSDDQVRQLMVRHFGLRIGSHMTQYVQKRLLSRDHAQVPVMGGDARTGVAIRMIIALQALESAASAAYGAPQPSSESFLA